MALPQGTQWVSTRCPGHWAGCIGVEKKLALSCYPQKEVDTRGRKPNFFKKLQIQYWLPSCLISGFSLVHDLTTHVILVLML